MAQRRSSRGRRNLPRSADPTETPPRTSRPVQVKENSPLPKYLVFGGLIVVAVVATLLLSGGDDRGGETKKEKATSGDKVADLDTSGAAKPAGGDDDPELDPELKVDKAEELLEEYRRKVVLAESTPDKIALAKWCEKNGFEKEMKELVDELLVTNPDDSDLNRMSGKKLFDGEHLDYQDRWMTPEEYAAAKAEDAEYVKKLASDPKFEAMHSTISNAKFGFMKDFKHSAIRMWPYVVFLEDFGSKKANERYRKDYRIRIGAFYDYMKKTYPNIVNREPDTPFRIIVLKDRASFNKFNELNGNGATGSRAFYHLKTKFIYTYEKAEGGDSLFERGVVFHECTHQLLDFLRPKRRYSESMWFEEALSDFHAGVRIQAAGDGAFTYELGKINGARLNQMAMALKSKKYFALERLFRCRTYAEADQTYKSRFGGKGSVGKSLLYYQGWSFIYFCMEGPNPKYREAILKYLDQDVGQGEGDYNILKRAFGLASDDQWGPIQREWEAYVRKLIKERKAARAKRSNKGMGRKRDKKKDKEKTE